MSVSLQLFLGPYLACRKPVGEVTRVTRICSNKHCARFDLSVGYQPHKFCTNCGSAIAEKRTTTVEKISPADKVREAVNDRLCDLGCNEADGVDPNLDIFIPNKGRSFDFVTPKFLPFDAELEKLKAENLEWFASFFKDDIAKVKEAYGEDGVTLCWGLCAWYW